MSNQTPLALPVHLGVPTTVYHKDWRNLLDAQGNVIAGVAEEKCESVIRSINALPECVKALKQVRIYISRVPVSSKEQIGVQALNLMIIDDAIAIANGDPDAVAALTAVKGVVA